jgi:hypothetical protein
MIFIKKRINQTRYIFLLSLLGAEPAEIFIREYECTHTHTLHTDRKNEKGVHVYIRSHASRVWKEKMNTKEMICD